MPAEIVRIFDAALALPQAIRADLAAKLIESLEDETPPRPDRTPAEWEAVIKARSDAIHSGEAELVDGEEAIARLRAIVRRE